MLSTAQQKKLERLAKVLDNGDIALLTELDTLESRFEGIEGQLPTLREAKDGEAGPMGPQGKPGESIVGPMGPAGRDGTNGKDSTVPGPQGPKGDTVVGPAGKDGADGFVDIATIAYLEDEIKRVEEKIPEIVKQKETNFGFVIRDVVAGTGVTIDKSDPNRPVVNATATGGGHTIEDEGTPLTQRDTINFVGSGVAVTDAGGKTVVTIGGGGSTAWGDITGTLSDQTDLNSALAGKSDTSHTHTGVYEPADSTILKDADIGVTVLAQRSFGTAANSNTGDFAPALGADDNYVTDAEKTVIGNTAGTNTGDDATNSQYSGLAASKQDTLVSGTNIKTINSTSLLGSGNIVITGGGGVAGQATVNFGAVTQEDSLARVTVSTASALTASIITVSPAGVATTDHDPDDYQWDNISGYVTNIIDGVSFDIIGVAPNGSWGDYKFNYIIS